MTDIRYDRLLSFFERGKKKNNSMKFITLSFVVIILSGALLLMLPISSADGTVTDFLSALFTSTSATCVTGLIVVDTATHWTTFGHVVILLLIQVGGLGSMTVISLLFFVTNRRLGLRERIVMMQSLNLSELEGVVRLIKHVLLGTLFFETLGAVILSARFIPYYGIGKGIWCGVFHSVSAFCNAGFDIIGYRGSDYGAMAYNNDPVVLLTLASLLIIGGLGFFVWEDVYMLRTRKKLRLHSKITLIVTAVLLLGGMALFLLLESGNPGTLGPMGFWQKLYNAFFQSATPRTAGYNSIDQGLLTDPGKTVTILLMYIGAGGGSTAGGIKVVTVGVLVLSMLATLRGKRSVVAFERRIDDRTVVNAAALMLISLSVTLVSGLVLSAVEQLPFINTLYETVSAYSTVGLTTGITSGLGAVSRLFLIANMFMGRVGVLTISVALMTKTAQESITYPTDNVMVG